jgi:acetyl esterase/lipase
MRTAVTALICTGFGLIGFATQAQSIPKEVAARVELYGIPSLTISDQQFLTGDANGTQVTVAGELRVAQATGRLPVVVLMHGSGGVGATTEAWVHHFNAMGISTFVIDGFTGRGLTTVSPNQALLGRLNLIVDVYRSLDILAKHPRVDPERIVLMGFHAADRPRCLRASIVSTSSGINPARSSPPTFRSIRIARRAT